MGELLGGTLIIGVMSAGFLRVYRRVESGNRRLFLAVLSAYGLAVFLASFGMWGEFSPDPGVNTGYVVGLYLLPALVVLGVGRWFYKPATDSRRTPPDHQ